MKNIRSRIMNRLLRTFKRATGQRVRGVLFINEQTIRNLQASTSGIEFISLEENERSASLKPICLDTDFREGFDGFLNQLKTVAVSINNAEFLLCNDVIIDPNAHIWYHPGNDASNVIFFREAFLKNAKHIQGAVAYLSNTWASNYYHWMQLTLPMLRGIQQIEDLSKIDYYYIGDVSIQPFMVETLARFGIGRGQIINKPCRPQRLFCSFQERPSPRYRDSFGHKFVAGIYRSETKRCAVDRKSEKVFVRRGTAGRNLSNEEEIMNFFLHHGFKCAEMGGLSFESQAKTFNEADIIVGVHGAALTNVLFARSGSLLVEIFPQDHIEASYYSAASHANLSYAYVIGEALTGRSEFHLSVKKLEELEHKFGLFSHNRFRF